ncbi:MAG: glycosyltransferase [Patescibacteria group bacterium]|nr:glycosyltransferase [Patescibacteria group bacterium]MDE2116315.1 glycosyltransferase [Patescibacteria group bacterium]
MKILFYSDNLYPEISGISDSIISLAEELKRRGHVVAFAGPRYGAADYAMIGKTPTDPSPLDRYQVCRIPGTPLGAGAASGVGRMIVPFGWSLGFVRRFKPDVIHTQSPFGAGIEAYLASRIFGVSLVGTNHTAIDQYIRIYGPFRGDWAVWLANKMFALYYNRCVFMSAPAAALVREMRSYGLKTPAQMISNPTSLGLFSPATDDAKQAIRRELGLDGRVVMFSGRLGIEKKTTVLLRGFARLRARVPDARLVIAGGGPVETSLRALVAEENLGDSVVFTGFLDHPTLAKWYKAADVFANMCPIETQCLSLMQAFASALPAVGVDQGAVGEHIKPEFGYTVPDGGVEALARALERLLADPAAARAMGEQAFAYVRQFSQSAVADIWEEVYGKSLDRHTCS